MWFLFLLLGTTTAIRCLNFYGFETERHQPVCDWKHPPSWYLDKASQAIHIDTVRLPFSYQYASCSDFADMDGFIRECAKRNINVILDYHRGYADHQGMSPEEKDITKEMWIDILIYILGRYNTYTNVIGISLFNEFQIKDTKHIEDLQIEAVNEIEQVMPGRYTYFLGCADWGKDCRNMWYQLPINNSMIEIHTYGFNNNDFTQFLPTKLPSSHIFIGEVGWFSNQTEWFQQFKSKFRRRHLEHVCLWTLAHSHDTGNLFQDDCETLNNNTVELFNSLFDKPTCLTSHKNSFLRK